MRGDSESQSFQRVPNPYIEAKFLSSARFRVALFHGLSTENASDREDVLESISNIVRSWASTIPNSLKNKPEVLPLSQEVADKSTSSHLHSNKNASFTDTPWQSDVGESVMEESESEELVTKSLLQLHTLTMLRLSRHCPYQDVRNAMRKLLKELKDLGFRIPKPIHASPSYFIPLKDIPSLDVGDEFRSPVVTNDPSSFATSPSSYHSLDLNPSALWPRIVKETFNNSGRITHLFRIMGYFPSYLEKFRRVYSSVIRGTGGPIPRTWRYYIGIMASSCHSCQYLVSLLRSEFLLAGGDPSWLKGLPFAPHKIQKLAIINEIVAHQPWLLTPEHIASLVKGAEYGGSSANSNTTSLDNWTMSELVQAFVTMSIYHSLSTFSLGCGLLPEIDTLGGVAFDQEDTDDIDDANVEAQKVNNQNEHSRDHPASIAMPSLSESSRDSNSSLESLQLSVCSEEAAPEVADVIFTTQLISKLKKTQNGEEDMEVDVNQVQKQEEFEKCENLDIILTPPHSKIVYPYASSLQVYPPQFEPLSRFSLDGLAMKYEDFNVKSSNYSVFRLTDWSWEDHGVGLVSKYLGSDVGELIDDEFEEVKSMTDCSLAALPSDHESHIDTAPFRTAIWYYVLRLFGQSHDDYQYSLVNHYLNKKIKSYIKKVACTPEKISYSDFMSMGVVLRLEEKCHITLLVMEARRQAELVYMLNNVMKFTEKR